MPEQSATLIYFLTSYFTISTNWADLFALGKAFWRDESSQLIDRLVNELRQIQRQGDWAYIQHLAHTHSHRLLSDAQAEQLVEILLAALEEPTDAP